MSLPRSQPPRPGPVRAPATARGRATRRALLDAAEQVFGDRGYASASVAQITRRADVAHGTFYVYFASKAAIFEELVRQLSQAMSEALGRATEAGAASDEAELRALLAFVREHRGLYRIVRQAEFVAEEAFREHHRALAAHHRALAGIPCDPQGPGSTEREALAYARMGICDFVGMRWGLWEHGEIPEAVIHTAVRLLRGACAPNPEPPGSPR